MKTYYIYIMRKHSTVKMKFIGKWMELEIFIVTEITEIPKEKGHIFSQI